MFFASEIGHLTIPSMIFESTLIMQASTSSKQRLFNTNWESLVGDLNSFGGNPAN